MAANSIRIVLVDDHKVLLESLTSRINTEAEMEVVGTAVSGEEGLQTILENKPDIALLDIEVPGRGAFDVAGELSRRQKETKIAFLTGYISDVFISQALKLKVCGYLMKGEPMNVILSSIKRIGAGEMCFSQAVRERITFHSGSKRYTVNSASPMMSLTSRQLEVLRYLALGHSVKQVAKTMHLSEKSIDSHKYRIMHKLGIHDRVELARFAIREGLTLP